MSCFCNNITFVIAVCSTPAQSPHALRRLALSNLFYRGRRSAPLDLAHRTISLTTVSIYVAIAVHPTDVTDSFFPNIQVPEPVTLTSVMSHISSTNTTCGAILRNIQDQSQILVASSRQPISIKNPVFRDTTTGYLEHTSMDRLSEVERVLLRPCIDCAERRSLFEMYELIHDQGLYSIYVVRTVRSNLFSPCAHDIYLLRICQIRMCSSHPHRLKRSI